MTSLSKFKTYGFELRDRLGTIHKLMYTNLQEFQNHATQFLTKLENVKDEKVVLYGVQLIMDELKKCKQKRRT